jgi:hypothetical protein
VPFDLPAFSERHLLATGHHRIKTASVLLAGADIRDRMPPMTLSAYLRTYWHAPYAYMAQVFRGTDLLRFPLTYPDTDGEFFGYDRQDDAPQGGDTRSTKALVATVCWIATMLVGFQTGLMIGTKAESVRAYREMIGGPWADFVERMYAQGKEEWRYRVPERTADRARLRDLCARLPAFENHYLTVYRSWLLDQLHDADGATQRFVALRLGEVRYPDAAVQEALVALTAHTDASVRAAAATALRVNETHGAPDPV